MFWHRRVVPATALYPELPCKVFAHLFGDCRRISRTRSFGAYSHLATVKASGSITLKEHAGFALCFACALFTFVGTASAGHQLCRQAWLRFMGIGKGRLRRTKARHRGLDERGSTCGALEYLDDDVIFK